MSDVGRGRTLALIPARGGSKRLPGKHLLPLGGEPVLLYTLRAARTSSGIDLIRLTTDDPDIQELGRRSGVAVIDRPPELAKDDSPTADAVAHALGVLDREGVVVDHIVLLQPTSPMRTPAHVEEALSLYFASGARPVISVTPVHHPPQKDFLIEGSRLVPLFSQEFLFRPRQSLPTVYRQNGAIYVISRTDFEREQSFYTDEAVPYVMGPEASVDLDSPSDLAFAEWLLSRDGSP